MKKYFLILLTCLSFSTFGQTADVVTFEDKDKTAAVGNPKRFIRDIDMNELKAVINQHATLFDAKQTLLISGTNIKTIDGNSILGSGNLGVATDEELALKAPIASPTFTGTISGITKTMVGLGNVDNTSDVNKPVSTATQNALNLKTTNTNFAVRVTPSGTINGINSIFTIPQTPVDGSDQVFVNGILQVEGTHYTRSVATFTFVEAPETGDVIKINYIRP